MAEFSKTKKQGKGVEHTKICAAPPTGVCAQRRRQEQWTELVPCPCSAPWPMWKPSARFRESKGPCGATTASFNPSTPPHPLLLCRGQGEDLRGSRGGNIKGWFHLCSLRFVNFCKFMPCWPDLIVKVSRFVIRHFSLGNWLLLSQL